MPDLKSSTPLNNKDLQQHFLLLDQTSLFDYLPDSTSAEILDFLLTRKAGEDSDVVFSTVGQMLTKTICLNDKSVKNVLRSLHRKGVLNSFDELTCLSVIKMLEGMPFQDSKGLEAIWNGIPVGKTRHPSQINMTFTRMQGVFLKLFQRCLDVRLQVFYRIALYMEDKQSFSSRETALLFLKSLKQKADGLLTQREIEDIVQWLSTEKRQITPEDVYHGVFQGAFPIVQVNLRFTHHCNAACKHCYNNSHPQKKQMRLSEEAMINIIREAPSYRINGLNLTGGEPFLYPETTLSMVQEARKAHLDFISVITNGFWGGDVELLEKLKNAGFMKGKKDILKISAGTYHREYIPDETVFKLAGSFYHLFGAKALIDCEFHEEEEKKAFEEAVQKNNLTGRVRVLYRKVFPLGRGRNIKRQIPGKPLSAIKACSSINQIVIDPDRTVRPCCGLNFDNKGVIIGELTPGGLSPLIYSMQNNPYLQLVASLPFAEIFKLYGMNAGKKEYFGDCDACEEFFKELNRGNYNDEHHLLKRQEFYPFCPMVTLSKTDDGYASIELQGHEIQDGKD